ncbi:monovalent cation/H+ antiporter complex subunit F [Anaerosolibacter sp.]|uniref:monovalent cation/H+ antiporter complex subunit F n=1 Tax=Anaerosolibacter sp. TaxID=1872527 RepID=UPI0039EF5A41
MFIRYTMYLLGIAMLTILIKMLRSDSIWERLLCVNLISAKTILLLASYAVYHQNIFFLDVSITYGIIGFLSITLLSRFMLKGGRLK